MSKEYFRLSLYRTEVAYLEETQFNQFLEAQMKKTQLISPFTIQISTDSFILDRQQKGPTQVPYTSTKLPSFIE